MTDGEDTLLEHRAGPHLAWRARYCRHAERTKQLPAIHSIATSGLESCRLGEPKITNITFHEKVEDQGSTVIDCGCFVVGFTSWRPSMTSTAALGGRENGEESSGGGIPERQQIVPSSGVERGGPGGGESRVVDGRVGGAPAAAGAKDGEIAPIGDAEKKRRDDMEETCRRICKTLKEDCKVRWV